MSVPGSGPFNPWQLTILSVCHALYANGEDARFRRPIVAGRAEIS